VHFLLLLRLPLGSCVKCGEFEGEVFLVPFTDSAIEEAFRGRSRGGEAFSDKFPHVTRILTS
jgi:hypothetical protein